MSGGHFSPSQYALRDISEEIERLIQENNEGYEFSAETIAEFRKTVALLGDCFERVHEIDYLVSADTGEDSFLNAMKRMECFNRGVE